MKKLIFATALLVSGVAQAATFVDSARVVSVQPAHERVTNRECSPAHSTGSQYSTGENIAGTLVGGLIGGALGNQIGGGRGNTLATVVGAVGGAAVGDKMTSSHKETVQECRDVVTTRAVGYDTTYEYRGNRETIRTSFDPGVGNLMEVSVTVRPTR